MREIHTKDEVQLQKRGSLPGYELLGAAYDRSYCTASIGTNFDVSHFSGILLRL